MDDPLEEDAAYVAVAPDADFFPGVVLRLPMDENGVLMLAPEEAMEIGMAIWKSASLAAYYCHRLADKTVEERQEILELESSLLND